MKRIFLVAAAVLCLAACCQTANRGPITTGEDCIAQTTYGQLLGYNDDGIYTFKGIRYAKAERFMPPQEPDSWEGVKRAQSYGHIARQGQNLLAAPLSSPYDFGFEFKLEREGEDCQVLNVWTPALDGKKRPVFLWIHGGGYSSGSAIFLPAQDGRALAEKGDIVVVTVNHRLNVLGYINLTGLGGKYSESVNLGQQDLVKALEWIHNNIENFGGDPGRVTIGGQSGGGMKSCSLMAMPSAKGLFHGAIIQSGAALSQGNAELTQQYGIQFVKELGLQPSGDVDLSTFSYEELVAASNRAGRIVRGGGLGPVVDGKYIVQNSFTPVAADCAKDVAVLVGTCLNEFNTNCDVQYTEQQVKDRLVPRMGEEGYNRMKENFFKAYPDAEFKDMLNTESNFRKSSLTLAAAKSEQGGADCYVYLFGWKTAVNGGALGASHGCELPFTFNNIANSREMTGGTKEAYKMADAISSAWISFIRTGNPNCKQLPAWEPYTKESGATMFLDNKSELKHHFDDDFLGINQ